jgi:hypothetical protein
MLVESGFDKLQEVGDSVWEKHAAILGLAWLTGGNRAAGMAANEIAGRTTSWDVSQGAAEIVHDLLTSAGAAVLYPLVRFIVGAVSFIPPVFGDRPVRACRGCIATFEDARRFVGAQMPSQISLPGPVTFLTLDRDIALTFPGRQLGRGMVRVLLVNTTAARQAGSFTSTDTNDLNLRELCELAGAVFTVNRARWIQPAGVPVLEITCASYRVPATE